MTTLKPQPTLRGYNAWALLRFVEVRGTTAAEGAAWIIDHFFEDNKEMLEEEYEISLKRYRLAQGEEESERDDQSERGENVVEFEKPQKRIPGEG